MSEILQYEFMRNALMAGLLVSIACGLVGTLIVVNRISFMAGGMAHTAYGGIGLALFAGLPMLPTTVAFTIIAALLMGIITLKNKELADVFISVLWTAGMAIGIIFLDFTPGYKADIMSYLFGSILLVSKLDLLFMLLVDLIMIIFFMFFYQGFLILSFDSEYGETKGVPIKFLYFLLLTMSAITIVMLIKIMGIILAIALLIIPPSIAQRTKSLNKTIICAGILSIIFCSLGLILSYYTNVTASAAIIFLATFTFLGQRTYLYFKNKY